MSISTPAGARATGRSFHLDLDQLCATVGQLAELAQVSIDLGTNALLAQPQQREEAISAAIAHDRQVDELTGHIEENSLHLLALQQPMARDLRTLVTIVRVIHELERIGDNMVNIAKGARRMAGQTLDERLHRLVELMRDQAHLQLQAANRAFLKRDPVGGARVGLMDDAMDDLQKELFRHVFTLPASEESLQLAVQVSLIGRYYERVADHATNYGQRVAFMVTGIPGVLEVPPQGGQQP